LAAFLSSPLAAHWSFVDLRVYVGGGQTVLHGGALYDRGITHGLAFTYPPFSALAFTALSTMPLRALTALVTAGNLVLLVAVLRLALTMPPMDRWLVRRERTNVALVAAAVAIWTEPVWSTLRYGQVDLLVTALVVYDLGRADGTRGKGLSVGLAAGLKLTPLIFVLYLALTRSYRAAATALTAFATTVAVGWLALPADAARYWGAAVWDPGRVGRIENAANQSLRGALARVLHTVDVQRYWIASAMVVGFAGLLLAARAGRAGQHAHGFAVCGVTGLLVSPVSWTHHWVLALPGLLAAAVSAVRNRSAPGIAAVAVITAIACSHATWLPRHAELALSTTQLWYADAYVLTGLAALLWSACSAAKWMLGPTHHRYAGMPDGRGTDQPLTLSDSR